MKSQRSFLCSMLQTRSEITNSTFKFRGCFKKFSALLDAVELYQNDFLPEKKPTGFKYGKAKKKKKKKKTTKKKLSRCIIFDSQIPRKKRSNLIIGPAVPKSNHLGLQCVDVDSIVVVEKQEMQKLLRQQILQKSKSGKTVGFKPEIPDLNLPPPPCCA